MRIGKPDHQIIDKVRYFFLGHPLRKSTLNRERLGIIGAIAVFAVDALSSVAYATEEIILALSKNPALLDWSWWIALIITGLLVILILSYTQTVAVFPNGGGAYTVSKTYLGENAALLAASALMIDYILTVAVSVCAGVRSLSSAFPFLRDHNVLLACSLIIVLCWINLRGIRESARLLIPPVYAFIFILLFVGGYGASLSHLPPSPSLNAITDLGALLILLRAFSSGCSAMTGIEALANAGSVLQKPQTQTAQRVLILLGICLGSLFLSITWTAQAFQLRILPEESLISQITRLLLGKGVLYEGIQILVSCILLLAANTAFAGFPKLASILGEDGWLPRQLSALGDRLVFANGIILLALAALILVVLFDGDTHRLIPLYAIGVFMAFSLSQMGMAVHWFKTNQPQKWIRCFINGFGCLCTSLALLITFESKFFEGAFLVAIIIPLFWGLLRLIQNHYRHVYTLLKVRPEDIPTKKKFTTSPKRPVVVPVSQFHLGTMEALSLARELSSDVTAVIIDIRSDNERVEQTCQQIRELNWEIKIEVIFSPYRSIVQPIVDFIQSLDETKKTPAVVVLPEFILTHWWQDWLHNHTADHIKKILEADETLQGEARVIINVPYYLPDGAKTKDENI